MSLTPTIRTLACLGLLVLGAAPAAAQQAAAPAPPGGSGRPAATLTDCHVAVDQAARYATFAGQMTTVAGSDRMAMRVDLEERDPGGAFRYVSAPNLGVWRRSASGVAALRYVKQVTNLPAPASFRAVIRFRWLDATGNVLRRAVRRSDICAQPDERPRLDVAGVDAGPGSDSSSATYRITIRNDGRGAAMAFGVVLAVNGSDQPALTVATLDPGARTTLVQVAPRCPAAGTVTVTPDPQHQVGEAVGGGLSRTLPCPAGARVAGSGRSS